MSGAHARLLSLTLFAILLLPAPLQAGCTVDVRPLAFGVVDLGSINHARGTIVIQCDVETDVSVALTSGFGGSQRAMVGPNGARLVYEIFSSLQTLQVWGDGNGYGEPVQVHLQAGERRTLTAYGVVPAQPSVPEGTYSDQLIVVLTF